MPAQDGVEFGIDLGVDPAELVVSGLVGPVHDVLAASRLVDEVGDTGLEATFKDVYVGSRCGRQVHGQTFKQSGRRGS